MGGFEEMRIGSVICPKPRRFGFLNLSEDDYVGPLRYPISHHMEMGDSTAATELLESILTKGDHDSERLATPISSSPPFFIGPPPCRASNPLIQDAQFGNERLMPVMPSFPAPQSPSSCKGGTRMKFGNKPATVRIEGFDCLGRDHRNCSISAVA